jgi:hypothetical protein
VVSIVGADVLSMPKPIKMVSEIYYITGRGGSIHEGLGVFLKSKSHSVTGISLSKEFLAKTFEDQVDSIRSELQRIEAESIPVIANSYGAYLLLLSLISRPSLETKVLLLSPVVGTLVSKAGYFKPPYAESIPAALNSSTLRKPANLEIHVGSLDNQCDLEALEFLANTLSADRFQVHDGQGHMIDKLVVANLVDRFLVL